MSHIILIILYSNHRITMNYRFSSVFYFLPFKQIRLTVYFKKNNKEYIFLYTMIVLKFLLKISY